MDNDVIIEYDGMQVSVPKEVADFLEEDRRRMAAQERRDRRHLSRSSFEQMLSRHADHRGLEDEVAEDLRRQSLRKAVAKLRPRDRELIAMRYEDEMTTAAIGERRGVSRMAVSKQLKKVHDVLGRSVK